MLLTALPPNGTDQRLLHCSLPLCLCSEYAHCESAGLHRFRQGSLPYPHAARCFSRGTSTDTRQTNRQCNRVLWQKGLVPHGGAGTPLKAASPSDPMRSYPVGWLLTPVACTGCQLARPKCASRPPPPKHSLVPKLILGKPSAEWPGVARVL